MTPPPPDFFDSFCIGRQRKLPKCVAKSTCSFSFKFGSMPELTREEKLRLLTILLESRHGDLREQNLNRQGKGHFHVSGMGHEALAPISIQMQEDAYIVPFYRDRA